MLPELRAARDLPDNCPFWDKGVTLGLVREGRVEFDNTVSGKDATLRALVAGELPEVVLFAAWTGSYSTDLFALTSDDAGRLLQRRRR